MIIKNMEIISIDNRVELITIIQTLDNYWENLAVQYTNGKLLQCKYKEIVWDYFAKYKNHSTVKMYNKLCNDVHDIGAFIQLALYYSNIPNLEKIENFSISGVFEPKFPFGEFINGLKQFYYDTNFEYFLKKNQPEYKKMTSDYLYNDEVINNLGIVDNYLEKETKNYRIVISALIFGCFGFNIKTNENSTFNYSVISPYDYIDNKYIFGPKSFIKETIRHEVCHLTINDLTKKYIEQININEKTIPDHFKNIFYTSIESIINEYIIRAITVRLFEIHNEKDIAEKHLQNHIQKGFKELKSIKIYLEKYCEMNNKLMKNEKYKELMNYILEKI